MSYHNGIDFGRGADLHDFEKAAAVLKAYMVRQHFTHDKAIQLYRPSGAWKA